MNEELPILDNHMHLRGNGKGIKAAKEFSKAGGTHIVLVNLPSWTYGVNLTDPSNYKKPFDKCIAMSKEIDKKTDLNTYPVIGVHPAELTKWTEEGKSLEETFELMKKGLNLASEYIKEKKAIALGEIGRPHYPVSKEVMELSHELIRHSFRLANDNGFSVQLHTESMTKEDVIKLSKMINESGLDKSKVIKHFSNPIIDVYTQEGILPSIISKKENLKEAIKKGSRFLMETDYLDDPQRPGAVLGPKNVPKKTNWLLNQKIVNKEDLINIHKTIPEEAYGIKVNL
ncbi:metal-dependent hydrolase [archaeon SCG-AAA382B04]|nr:metal-dependent hydrolase [archaeon SCG-AAA382B04]